MTSQLTVPSDLEVFETREVESREERVIKRV